MKSVPLIVVDTETGGLEPDEASIIELAAQIVIIRPGKIVRAGEEFCTRMKPTLPVGEGAAKVNGYNEGEWHDAPTPEEALSLFDDWLVRYVPDLEDKPTWSGCNPSFDLKFVRAEYQREKMYWPNCFHYRTLDISSMCMPLFLLGQVEGVGLRHLRKWAKCDGEQKHRALEDVHDSVIVIQEYMRLFGAE